MPKGPPKLLIQFNHHTRVTLPHLFIALLYCISNHSLTPMMFLPVANANASVATDVSPAPTMS